MHNFCPFPPLKVEASPPKNNGGPPPKLPLKLHPRSRRISFKCEFIAFGNEEITFIRRCTPRNTHSDRCDRRMYPAEYAFRNREDRCDRRVICNCTKRLWLEGQGVNKRAGGLGIVTFMRAIIRDREEIVETAQICEGERSLICFYLGPGHRGY
ncbi:hypothetical protein CEXT_467221 [Caerostris extrusa]|uniref:Uncharacterized protein n=1 Tax=Caerostris extrusa TaxID=172846 RepID=A0AAV4WCW9_CAEEX|nr:hypothetical protein CEXT_467221 [Caerostris extrusa]